MSPPALFIRTPMHTFLCEDLTRIQSENALTRKSEISDGSFQAISVYE